MKTETFKKVIYELEVNFLKSLIHKGLDISNNATCIITDKNILIGLRMHENSNFKICSYSEIRISIKNCKLNSTKDNVYISYNAHGKFSRRNKSEYWKAIHVAEILKKWDFVSQLSLEYCQKVYHLINQFN